EGEAAARARAPQRPEDEVLLLERTRRVADEEPRRPHALGDPLGANGEVHRVDAVARAQALEELLVAATHRLVGKVLEELLGQLAADDVVAADRLAAVEPERLDASPGDGHLVDGVVAGVAVEVTDEAGEGVPE